MRFLMHARICVTVAIFGIPAVVTAQTVPSASSSSPSPASTHTADPFIPSELTPSAVRISSPIDASSFVRFQHPDECARAAPWAERAYWRDREFDTVAFPRSGLPLRRSTVAEIKACLTRFPFERVAPRDLLGLGEAYLAARQPDDAARAFVAAIHNAKTSADRAWTLRQVVTTYSSAAEPLLIPAQRAMAELDAMGAGAAAERMVAHTALANVARFRDSLSLQKDEANAAVAASRQLLGDARKAWAPNTADAYNVLALYLVRVGEAAAAKHMVDSVVAALEPLRRYSSLPLTTSRILLSFVGIPAPRLTATEWLNTNETQPIRPLAGKPSLVLFTRARDPYALEGIAVFRRLHNRYASRGLTTTLVTRTIGVMGGNLVTPDTERAILRSYFLDVLHLPVTVALTETTFGHRSDGRRVEQNADNESRYRVNPNIPVLAYLVDAAGQFRWVGALDRDNEAVVTDLLNELLPR